ncbi:MAG: hypothetical protein QM785_00035 [Pyrinomonadaceae bacterium]
MKFLAVLILLLGYAGSTESFGFQTATSTPQSAGPLPQSRPSIPTEYELRRLRNNADTAKEEELKRVRENKALIAKYVEPLYRKPTAVELSPVAIKPEVKEIFASFLSREGRGIFTITPDLGCAETIGVIAPGGECLKFPFPGAGNAYSFRTASYRMRSVADMTFSGANFYAPGALTQGIFVNLGDIPIEDVDLRSKGMAYLTAFRPPTDVNSVSDINKILGSGVDSDGFRYASSIAADINKTYALRSVAYRGEVVRSFQGILFNELDYDRRRDVIVVFRTVGFDLSGKVTIIWSILRDSEAPKLNTQK